MGRFESHFSVLQTGKTPHPPHQHLEEEIIVLLSGQLVVIREDAATGQLTEEQAAPGELVYHSSANIHTLRAVGPAPARYLIFKWGGGAAPGPVMVLSSKTMPYDQAFATHEQSNEGFAKTVIFENPTRYLRKLHCHASTLRPGAGYDPHDDNYDVAIVLLKGIVETVGQRVEAPSAIFYSADRPHGLRNVGDIAAQYVVFEFHGLMYR
jgi:quercetin dioxygenase-like cupin family protein